MTPPALILAMALAAAAAVPAPEDGLPFRYYIVGPRGTHGHLRLEEAGRAAGAQPLEAGFAIAVVEERVQGGALYGRTRHELWVPMHDLLPVVPIRFHGEEVRNGRLDFGWLMGPAAGRAPLSRVSILEERGRQLRIAPSAWVPAGLVQRPSLSPRPAEVRPGERWIDVELSSQTLVSYEGDRPVFATLVSTGVGRRGTPIATPEGVHRVRAKLLSATMDDLEHAGRHYSVEDAPYVQYFARGAALHGAFWHQRFGHVHSHGCINLAPLDAQRLFSFTSPALPDGQSAVQPAAGEGGTVVRVR